MKLRKGNKKWTMRQIEEAIDEVAHDIRYEQKHIRDSQEKIEKLEILRKALHDMLEKYYTNPSSRTYDQNVPVTC